MSTSVLFFVQRRMRARLALFLLAVLGFACLVSGFENRLLQAAWRFLAPAAGGWAPLQVRVDAKPLPGVGNFSGLAWDERRGQLWGVINNPEELLALDRSGNILARWPLQGFQDVEDIAYLGDDLLLLLEERSHALLVLPVPRPGERLERRAARGFTLGLEAGDNKGLEGVAYDRAGDRLFIVKERAPRRLYELRGFKHSLQGDFDLHLVDHSERLFEQIDPSDLSAVTYDAASGRLLLLSDESRQVLALDDSQRLYARLNLDAGVAGLLRDVPQAEGLTLDEQGNLYVASEPNLFYVFGSAAADQPYAYEDGHQAGELAQADGRLAKADPAKVIQ